MVVAGMAVGFYRVDHSFCFYTSRVLFEEKTRCQRIKIAQLYNVNPDATNLEAVNLIEFNLDAANNRRDQSGKKMMMEYLFFIKISLLLKN
jgi:hypothetical protein